MPVPEVNEVNAGRENRRAPSAFEPSVAPEIWALRPDFIALSIVARNAVNAQSGDTAPPIDLAISPEWAEAHLEAWREAYRAFGARPQRTPCSAEALRKRFARDRALPRVNAMVDLYNAISVRYAVPVGGENLAAYDGSPRLVRADGGEPFVTVRDGAPAVENVDRGEVIWRDGSGVTCRRWNWRQTPRTRLDVTTTAMWFVLERLEPMPVDALVAAGNAMVEGVRRLAPDAIVESTLLRQP